MPGFKDDPRVVVRRDRQAIIGVGHGLVEDVTGVQGMRFGLPFKPAPPSQFDRAGCFASVQRFGAKSDLSGYRAGEKPQDPFGFAGLDLEYFSQGDQPPLAALRAALRALAAAFSAAALRAGPNARRAQ